MFKKLLLLVSILCTYFLQSQTLYWVGGAGYWNDATHWAQTSGGKPTGILPTKTTHVIFDNLSAAKNFTVHALQTIEVNSITSLSKRYSATLIGSPNVDVIVHGNVELNPLFKLKHNGKIILNANQKSHYEFSHNDLNNDVIVNSNSEVDFSVLETSKSVVFNGNLVVKNSYLLANAINFNKGNINLENCNLQAQEILKQNASSVKGLISSPSSIVTKSNYLAPFENIVGITLNPLAICTPTLNKVDPTCDNKCDGILTIDISACANGPFTFTVLANCTSPAIILTNLAAGVYTVNNLCGCGNQYAVRVHNSLNQLGSASIGIVDPPQSDIIFTPVSPDCFNLCNGMIILEAIGQTVVPLCAAYSTGDTHCGIGINVPDTLKNLCAGFYDVTTTNANGCLEDFNINLTQPNPLILTGVTTSVTCNGVCNGAATVTANGGNAGGYTYQWLPNTIVPVPSSTTTIVNTLCQGTFSVIATDIKGCADTLIKTIVQPPPITFTVATKNLNCKNVCNGSATITTSGGKAPYTYLLNPGAITTTSVITNLCDGPYTVTITDAQNCSTKATFTITSPPLLTASLTTKDVNCNGFCNGSATLTPSGGTPFAGNPAYSFTWTEIAPSGPITSTVSIANGLCKGIYSYTVTDALSCTTTNTFEIFQPIPISLTLSKTDLKCQGVCDGTASATVTGGTAGYTYTWSPGTVVTPPGQGTPNVTGLCAGNYSLNVQDINGCPKNITFTIAAPPAIVLNVTSGSIKCNGACTGSINATPSGGTGPYTITLVSPTGGTNTAAPPYTNLCAGTYTVRLVDTQGCLKTQVVNITQPNLLNLSITTASLNCSNSCNGSASAVISGGLPTYTVNWTLPTAPTSSTGLTVSNLCAGAISATVTDVNTCTATANTNLIAPPPITVTINATQPSCAGQCNGIATASVIGGTPNYTVTWVGGPTGTTYSNLCAGVYTANVRDSKGCTAMQTVTIIAPPALTLTATNGTMSCSGVCDASLSVVASGGTPNYSYNWNTTPVQSTSVTTNVLCQGNYAVTVTDSKGCTKTATASVTQPPVLTATITNVVPSCNICIGSATGQGLGGTAPYTYSWSTSGQTTQTATALCVGPQTVIVTDNRGCTATKSVQILPTVTISITTNGNPLACSNACSGIATANASGGTGSYTYTWTPASPTPTTPIQTTQTANNLCAAIVYTVKAVDTQGCSNTQTVSFTNPPAIVLTVVPSSVSCNGVCDGSAIVSSVGGTGPVTFTWMPNNIVGNSATNLCAGQYTVNASDANGCTVSQVVTISGPPTLTVNFTTNNPSTCTSNDGSITYTVSGGTSPYVSTPASPQSNLTDGVYTFTVTDFKGCQQIFSTTLNDPAGPTVTATSNSVSCFGLCNGSATVTAIGVMPITMTLNAVSVTNTIITAANLCSGIQIAQVEDGNGCITSQPINIVQSTQFTVTGAPKNLNCNAVCNGSVNLTVSGGTAGYNYTWTPAGGNVQDPVNLCANDYTVVISDANNCLTSQTYTITEPPNLSLTFNKQDVLCNGGGTGAVGVDVIGGTSPFSYSWTPLPPFPGSVLDTIINLSTGIYTVVVTDANGCSITRTINIDEPTPLTSALTVKNITCFGQCNGAASIIAQGGTLPYTFSPSANIIDLCVGTYSLNVTDGNGCLSANTFSITQPLPITIAATPIDPKCNNTCDGSVTTTVTGGNPNYSYSWITSGQIVPNPTGLCAGSHTVIVTDDSLCTAQQIILLNNPLALLANVTFTNPTCSGSCNGIATANPVNAVGTITYSWTAPLQTTQTATGLCPISYSLQITDGNGCVANQTINLTAPTPISINPATTPANCTFSNGIIDASNVAGGTAPYTYNWSSNPSVPLAQVNNTVVTNIPAGVYTVVVTDALGCTSTISIPLSDSDGPSGATITTTSITCFGLCNGSATISNPQDGTPGYTLTWVNPNLPNPITNLCVGTYTAQIKDAANCLLFLPATIAEPQAIDDNEIITSATCFGICNGGVALNPTGGNGVYTYSWSTSANTGTVVGLCPGPISATITDGNNCTFNANYNIPSLTSITANTFVINNKCFNDCNGTALATNVAGGLLPYSYLWTDIISQTNPSAINLCAGDYSVTITDANGCFNTLPATVTAPTQLTITSTVTQPNCGLNNGAISSVASGGTPTYTIQNNPTPPTNLFAGIYPVMVTDANGCVTNSNVVVNNSSGITGEVVTKKDVTCAGVCNGTISIVAVGGAPVVTYSWTDNGSTSQVRNNLCAGTYYCNMQDANGCIRTASVVINPATTLTLTPLIAQTSCTANTGSITVTPSGGTGVGTYSFAWSPVAPNTNSLTGLGAGNYSLTVTDANACSITDVFSINSINGPQVTHTLTNVSCAGLSDGDIFLTISGGTPTYTTNWSNGTLTEDLINVPFGAYSYTISDAAGCIAVDQFSLTQPAPLLFSAPHFDLPSCNNNCDGSITSVPFGGTLPFTYSWTPTSNSSPTATNLCVGNYTLKVTDGNGCPTSTTYSLTGPAAIVITATVTDVKCFGDSNGAITATATGGSGALTYSWSTSATGTPSIGGLVNGNYTLTINDANGCSQDTVFTVNPIIPLAETHTIVSAQCFGNCNGSIDVTAIGGNGGYTYSWTPTVPTPTNSITNICPGDYSLTITDAKGCSIQSNFNVPSIITVTTTVTAIDNTCFNTCNGTLTASNTGGGTGPYTHLWNDGFGTPGTVVTNLCNGTYSVTVTDFNGCFNRWPGIITSPTQVSVTPTTNDPSCGMCNGSATLALSGGTPSYSVNWNIPATGTVVAGLCAGVYDLNIIDGNNCTTNTSIIVNSSSGITGETIVTTDETCAGSCNGSATLTAIGGQPIVSYNWLHGPTTQTLSNLCSGIYTCNMTDANGCARTATLGINAATTLTITSQVNQTSCTANTGSITAVANGGTNTFNYVWTPPSLGTGTLVTGLAPGIYTLTATDGNGCSKTEFYTINSINAPNITSTVTNESCVGKCDGAIDLTITGGNPGYAISWSNGVNNVPSITSLCTNNYSVIITDASNCSAVRNFSISTNPAIAFNAPVANNPLCNNDCNGTINVLPIGGNPGFTFAWNPAQPTPETSAAINLCANNYSVLVTDSKGCTGSQSFTLTNPSKITFTATITDASCSAVADGAIDMTVAGGTPTLSFAWTPNVAITEDLTNVLYGPYTFTVTDAKGCTKDTSLQINATIVVIAAAGRDTTFCQNGSLLLDGSNSSGGVSYQWFAVPNPVAFSNTLITNVTPATGTSTYVLVATNGLCVDTDSIKVNSNALPSVDAGVSVYIPLSATVAIGGTPTSATASSFTWSPSFTLDNATISNPTANTTVTTIYTVSVTDVNGCVNSDTMIVNIFPQVIIPNGFSPNADGKNDTWVIDFINMFPDNEVEVYNRWGELLFYSKGYPIPWNGQYKNKDLPVGTYYYIINLNHPDFPKAYTGPLTIFR